MPRYVWFVIAIECAHAQFLNLDTLLDLFYLIPGCENKLECPGSAGCQNGVCTRKSHLPISFLKQIIVFIITKINNQFLNDYICVIFSY